MGGLDAVIHQLRKRRSWAQLAGPVGLFVVTGARYISEELFHFKKECLGVVKLRLFVVVMFKLRDKLGRLLVLFDQLADLAFICLLYTSDAADE